MILEIDIGNTCLKWRVIGSDECVTGRSEHGVGFLQDVNNRYGRASAVRIACVAREDVKNDVVERVIQLWGVVPQIAKTQKLHAGLEVVYHDPARLGVDRWLAMLAAYGKTKNSVCVIDCGSAITVDLVNAAGQQMGGYIVPGVAMQKSTLMRSTGQVRLEAPTEASRQAWGESTEEAVNYGVLRQIVSFIDDVIGELLVSNPSPRFFITGGDAEIILPMLSCSGQVCHYPDLVLDGLVVALA